MARTGSDHQRESCALWAGAHVRGAGLLVWRSRKLPKAALAAAFAQACAFAFLLMLLPAKAGSTFALPDSVSETWLPVLMMGMAFGALPWFAFGSARNAAGTDSGPVEGTAADASLPDMIPAPPPANADAGDCREALARLTARMSHDLRTPLNAVIGFSTLMHQEAFGPVGDERYREYARHIAQSGETLRRATDDALAATDLIARAPGKTLTPFSLTAIVDAIHAHQDLPAIADGASLAADDESATMALGRQDDIAAAVIRALAISLRDKVPIGAVAADCTDQAGFVWLTLSVPVANAVATDEAPPAANADATPYPSVDDDFEFCLAQTMLETMDLTLMRHCGPGHVTLKLGCQRAQQAELPLFTE
ncbi:MAG: histidine kinase dimerization/phospho-acceptor domain-containing protein [Pseudomonadota bacterium]